MNKLFNPLLRRRARLGRLPPRRGARRGRDGGRVRGARRGDGAAAEEGLQRELPVPAPVRRVRLRLS